MWFHHLAFDPWHDIRGFGKTHLDVPLEVRINVLDQWVISPAYKWDILGLKPTDPNL